MLGQCEGVVEFFEYQLHDALDLALLLRGKMIEVCAHLFQPSKAGVDLHPVIASFWAEFAATASPPQGQRLFAFFAL